MKEELDFYSTSEITYQYDLADLRMKENALDLERDSEVKKKVYLKQIISNMKSDVALIMENTDSMNELKVNCPL
jgi:hypothetical protein